MAKIKFVQDSKSPQDTKVYVDGVDITGSCRSIKINASANNVTTVMLDIFPSELEVQCEDVKLTTDNFTIKDMIDALTDDMLTNSKANYVKSKLREINIEKAREINCILDESDRKEAEKRIKKFYGGADR